MKNIKDLVLKIIKHHKLLGRDKLEHFYTSALGFALITFLLNDLYASVIVALAMLYKEIVNDWRNEKGNPEVLDAVMSILPILLYWLTKL